jgi:hypothetical protein
MQVHADLVLRNTLPQFVEVITARLEQMKLAFGRVAVVRTSCCGLQAYSGFPCISYVTEGFGIVHVWECSYAKRPVHWWWSWSMATDLGMSAPAPSTFLSSKTLSYESNQTLQKKVHRSGVDLLRVPREPPNAAERLSELRHDLPPFPNHRTVLPTTHHTNTTSEASQKLLRGIVILIEIYTSQLQTQCH